MPVNYTTAPVETQNYVRMFEEAEESSYEARERAERDRDYYDGIQLTDTEVAALRKRGQPPIVINRIRRKVDYLRGLEAQRRTDPKAFPRTPQHEQGAEAATDAIRYVCDAQDWDSKRSEIFENLMVEGYGGVEVVHDNEDIVINLYPWDRLFYDPHSRRRDFTDARYLGAVIWMDAAALRDEYPDQKDSISWTIDESSTSETYDDRPGHYLWSDASRDRVRVVLMYYIEKGVWKWAKFHKGGILEEGDSPYQDAKGKSVCPLLLQSLYVDRDNRRYGIVRDMIDAQDEINKRRSKALHLLTMRQVRMEKGAVDSVEDTRRELARPDGVVETQPDMMFEILNQADLASGQTALMTEAKNEIDLMGANSALAGQTGEDQSGRAVLARQQGGLVELGALFDQLHHMTKRVYEHVWMRVRQFWTEERWIRVTDDERNVRFVGLNRPVTVGEKLTQMPEQQAIQAAQAMGLRRGDPRLSMVADIENRVDEMDVDIQVEEVPEQIAMDAEQFQALASLGPALIQANPAYAPVFSELMISTAPGLRTDIKDRLREAITEAQQSAGQMGQQQEAMQAQAMQLEMGQAEANIMATQAKAKKDTVDAMRAFNAPL